MLVIRYTGLGWLAFILFLAVGAGCLLLTSALGMRDDAFLATFAASYVLVGVPLHWRIGTNLNSRRNIGGGQVHLFNGAPMEYWAVWYPTVAMVAVGVIVAKNGSRTGVWAVAIATLLGLIVFARLARKHWDRRNPALGRDGPTVSRRQLAVARGWQYRDSAPEIRDRWRESYGAQVNRLAPRRVLSGELEGYPFMVFDLKENTVCMIQLPVSLPDVRLRGRLRDEEQFGELPPVAAEPPWNCDLLPRISAQSLMEQGEEPPLAAESEVPGLADTLITAEVRRETLRCKVPGWRIHGRDLIFVSLPGARAGLSSHEAMAVVSGLAAIARALPVEVLDRFGRPWSGGPLVR